MSSKSRFTTGRTIVLFMVLVVLVTAPFSYSRNSRQQSRVTSKPSGNDRIPRRGSTQTGTIDKVRQISASGRQQIAALLAEKENRTPAQQKIDSQLLQAVREARGQQMTAGVNLTKADVKADDTGNLAVDISGKVSDALIAKIQNSGGKIIYASARYNTVRAQIKLTDVEKTAEYPEVTFIQPAVGSKTHSLAPPLPSLMVSSAAGSALSSDSTTSRHSFADRAANVRKQLNGYFANRVAAPYFSGVTTSEGDRTHRADDVRNTYGFEGEGVRIGVISDGFDPNGFYASPAIASGELPGPGNPLGHVTPVTVLQDFIFAAREGAAMLEIVHDIAPKAQLFFATAAVSEASFADNILALRNAPNNCDIIIDDVIYFDEPPFQDGIVAQAVNTVTASGALYFSSAGNEGSVAKNTASVWEGDFNDAGSTLIIPGNEKSGTVHNFGTVGSPVQADSVLSFGGPVILNWSDPQGASSNDYDLFLMNSALDSVFAASTNVQNGTQNPFEIVPMGVDDSFRIVVFKSSNAAVRAISLNTFGAALSVATSGQTFGHSAAADAFNVAATPASNGFSFDQPNGPFPGAFSSTNHVENFSSDGPRRIFYNADGTPVTPGNILFGTNGGVVRNKPDITAADGVSTSLGQFDPFFGTSASAPHAGAIAALIKSANPALTPTQIRTILTTTAADIESPGYDNVSGFGIVQAFQAMQAVEPITPATPAQLSLGQVTVTEGTFSNGNGLLDPGEIGNIVVELTNPTQMSVTNVKATLISPPDNSRLSVARNSASFGTIPPSGRASNAATPFVIGVDQFANCGTPLDLFLAVTFDGPIGSQGFTIPITVGHQPGVISAVLGQPQASNPVFTSTSGTQSGRLVVTGRPSFCNSFTSPPSVTDTTGMRRFDAYTFANNTGKSQCVTIKMTTQTAGVLSTAVYNSNGFDPTNPLANYLGDAGRTDTTQTFSFFAAEGQSFTVVVYEIEPGAGVESPYTLTVFLDKCSAGPTCTPVNITTPSIASGSVGSPYSQTFTATGGSGSYIFSAFDFPALPPGLSLSGNTLSGTPTQAGQFPITLQVVDAAGCPTGFQDYVLSISGNQPASIAPFAGDNGHAPPGRQFKDHLQAIVRDAANNPLPGVQVTFFVPSDFDPFRSFNPGGTFLGFGQHVSVVTDVNGIATAPFLTANQFRGIFTATAFINMDLSAQFNLLVGCAPVVTSLADNGFGSLREALAEACDGDEIIFAQNVTGTISLTTGELLITKSLIIFGPGANVLAVSGSHLSRVFRIVGDAPGGDRFVQISGLTIRDGQTLSTDRGGGGGIVVLGSLGLFNCVVTSNVTTNPLAPNGGGIEIGSAGLIFITSSSIVNNSAIGLGGGIHYSGAFPRPNVTGQLSVEGSTIAGNSAGAAGSGGGIEVDQVQDPQNVSIINSTIVGNSANRGGNIRIGDNISVVNLQQTIVAGGTLLGSSPSGADIDGARFTSGGFNLIQNTSPEILSSITSTDITGKNPLLLPLGNYGGPTPTMLPQPNSPVINTGSNQFGYDQRGLGGRGFGSSDIGAVQTNYAIDSGGGSQQSTPVNTAFGQPLRATVTESGSPIKGVTVTFSSPISGPSASFGGSNTGLAITDANGLAVAPTLTANGIGGSYSASASIGDPLVLPILYELTNLAIPSNISATGGTPQSTLSGSAFPLPLQATVIDSNNSLLQGINVTFTAPVSGARGTFPGGATSVTVKTNASGVATAPVFQANNIAGTYTVTASAGENVPPALFGLTNTPLPPNVFVFAGSPQNAPPGGTFPTALQAVVRDSGGTTLQGVNVTFTAPANGPSGTFTGGVTSAIVTTNSSGLAVAPAFTANGVTGPYVVTATVAGNPTPANFNLRNVVAGPPNSISATAGSFQTRGVGNAFPINLQATVLDANGVGVGGLTVHFTLVPNGNAGATFPGDATSATAITDSVGNAVAPILTANEFAGSYGVNATVAGVDSSVIFALTNRIVFGDITGEGSVNVTDLLVMANELAGNTHFTAGQKLVADVSDDGTHRVNASDLLTLANFLAGNIHTLPVGNTSMNAIPDFRMMPASDELNIYDVYFGHFIAVSEGELFVGDKRASSTVRAIPR